MIAGGDGNDVLLGGAGDDRLGAGPGRDRVHGEQGNDRMSGHAGHDVLLGGPDGDRIRAGAGGDTAYGNAGNDVIKGQSSADHLFGNGGRNRIFGNAGPDTLVSALSKRSGDRMHGGRGIDRGTSRPARPRAVGRAPAAALGRLKPLSSVIFAQFATLPGPLSCPSQAHGAKLDVQTSFQPSRRG